VAGTRQIGSGEELEKAVMSGITLVDFSAPWCAPCRLQDPIIQKIAVEFMGKALIVQTNIDRMSEVALKLGISSIPTLVIFRNSKEIQRFVGLQSETILSDALSRLLT